MSMNDAPSAVRLHIGFFGRRNAGKSSLVNALTNQQMSIVSEVAGTTTDPVKKSMELLPLGPVVITDTPGTDDEGMLGAQRVQKTREVLGRTDVAVLVIDSEAGANEDDAALIRIFEEEKIPFVIAWNKADQIAETTVQKESFLKTVPQERQIRVSAKNGTGIEELKALIGASFGGVTKTRALVSDIIQPGDLAVLVIPIDFAAPKGRLILPQQQVIRDILDSGAQALCVRESELAAALANAGRRPALVITDSQAFKLVSRIVPEEIPLTSFSILMARFKGVLEGQLQGLLAIDELKDGDLVLISEGCTHHRQCGDIGTVKIPAWLRDYTGRDIRIETSSGLSFPEELRKYKVIIHCGGCMLSEREVRTRNQRALRAGVPITNYGMLIAKTQGILERAIRPLNGTEI